MASLNPNHGSVENVHDQRREMITLEIPKGDLALYREAAAASGLTVEAWLVARLGQVPLSMALPDSSLSTEFLEAEYARITEREFEVSAEEARREDLRLDQIKKELRRRRLAWPS